MSEWTVKEVVEPATGKVHRFYSYKRRPCKRVVVDTPMAKQLAGYVLIEKDLRSAGIWLAEVDRLRGKDKDRDVHGSQPSKDRERYNVVKGLFVAALTFYGKAFAQCEGRRVKLERRQLSAEFHSAHGNAIMYRNNFAAHSGAKVLELAEVAVVLPPKSKAGIGPNLYREMTQPDYYSTTAEDKSFADLIEHSRELAVRKIVQLTEKVLKEDVLPKGYDYWARK